MSRDKMLHPQMESSLRMLPSNCHVHILTRHSIREMPLSKVVSYDLPLTAQGVLLAEQWGAVLTRPVESFYSSSVARCVDTAKAMASGQLGEFSSTVTIGKEGVLMEPGSYVSDMALAEPTFNEVGPLAFVSQHLSEEIKDGLVAPDVGAKRFMEYFQDKAGSENTLSVHVTHDTILATFVYHLMGISVITDELWPWMMEGMFIWFEGGNIHWIWRGEQYQRTISVNCDVA